ncbi:unnamed protein product [Amoebophrya sp. A25]|nr:unnamed protein product [Amoebophrya sp. A25]|eukprot:GSA25T00005563001.1
MKMQLQCTTSLLTRPVRPTARQVSAWPRGTSCSCFNFVCSAPHPRGRDFSSSTSTTAATTVAAGPSTSTTRTTTTKISTTSTTKHQRNNDEWWLKAQAGGRVSGAVSSSSEQNEQESIDYLQQSQATASGQRTQRHQRQGHRRGDFGNQSQRQWQDNYNNVGYSKGQKLSPQRHQKEQWHHQRKQELYHAHPTTPSTSSSSLWNRTRTSVPPSNASTTPADEDGAPAPVKYTSTSMPSMVVVPGKIYTGIVSQTAVRHGRGKISMLEEESDETHGAGGQQGGIRQTIREVPFDFSKLLSERVARKGDRVSFQLEAVRNGNGAGNEGDVVEYQAVAVDGATGEDDTTRKHKETDGGDRINAHVVRELSQKLDFTIAALEAEVLACKMEQAQTTIAMKELTQKFHQLAETLTREKKQLSEAFEVEREENRRKLAELSQAYVDGVSFMVPTLAKEAARHNHNTTKSPVQGEDERTSSTRSTSGSGVDDLDTINYRGEESDLPADGMWSKIRGKLGGS